MRAVLFVSILALAGCGGVEDTSAPVEQREAVETTPGSATEPPPGETAGEAGIIPTRFQGVWDYEGGTCDPASDMRMEIKPREIVFYESYGAVAGTGADGDDAIADLVMEGEGETWIQSLRFSLVDGPDGERLHVSDATESKVIDKYPRKKCPA